MKTNIFLIGMMGSGKSTIGNLLSQKLDIPFFDTDIEIEKIMDMSIDKIFNEFGENRFRMIESVFFNECIKADYYVYATGGGIVEKTDNHKALKNKGLIKIKNFQRNRNKFNYIYLLTPKGMTQKTKLTMKFMKRKMKEYDELKREYEERK